MKNKPRILFEEVLGFLIFKKTTSIKKAHVNRQYNFSFKSYYLMKLKKKHL